MAHEKLSTVSNSLRSEGTSDAYVFEYYLSNPLREALPQAEIVLFQQPALTPYDRKTHDTSEDLVS